MREKPTCHLCHAEFTRKGNMLRHLKDLHGVDKNGSKKNAAFQYSRTTNNFGWGRRKTEDNDSFFTKIDKHVARISELNKLSNDYIYTSNIFQNMNNIKSAWAFREKEILDIVRNNWLVPLQEIRGVSGHICRRCSASGFSPVLNIGCDKTEQANHTCDEQRVKSIAVCSIRKDVLLNTEKLLASRMLEFLITCMPGTKYIIAEDMSYEFSALEIAVGLQTAKRLFRVPDRLYFYSLEKGRIPDWMKRVLAYVGKKTTVQDFEISELLMMVKSSYALLEMPGNKFSKYILLSVTR